MNSIIMNIAIAIIVIIFLVSVIIPGIIVFFTTFKKTDSNKQGEIIK
jgi:flagellar basal body-associated protein FliL